MELPALPPWDNILPDGAPPKEDAESIRTHLKVCILAVLGSGFWARIFKLF